MDRRRYLSLAASAGAAGVAGCGALGGPTALSDPATYAEPGEGELEWRSDGESLCSFGVSGAVADGVLALSTETPHRDGTRVNAITLRMWLPDTSVPADIALLSPVEGDSSPPPSITLSTPSRGVGTQVEITDLDDLADETIATLDFLVRPRGPASEFAVDVAISLSGGGLLRRKYRLTGELRLPVPDLGEG